MSDETKAGKKPPKKVIRSPRYPAIPLQEAILKARTFFEHEKYSQVPTEVALKHWGYNPRSGPGLRLLSALLQYGLMEDEGSGNKRKVKLSELGRMLVLDERDDSEGRRTALRNAALKPSIYQELSRAHPSGLPSDENLRHELIMNRKFNPDVVGEFIADLRSTFRFANLIESDIMSENKADIDEERPGEDRPLVPRHEGKRMPETQLEDTRSWDLTIPLIGGGQAILRAPIPLSEENYTLLTSMLDSTLKSMKKAITKPEISEEEGG